MEHLFSRFKFIHIMDYFLPGCFLSAIIYIVLPETVKLKMPDSTPVFIIIFLICGGVIGVLNHDLSFKIVRIYEEDSFKKMFAVIGRQLKKVGVFFQKSFTTEVKEEEEVTESFLLKEEYQGEETEEVEQNVQPKKKKSNKFVRIIRKLLKKISKLQWFDSSDQALEALREENNELLTYLKDHVLSDYVKEASDEEIYNYICLYLQGKPMKSRLAEFISLKGINRNLCSASVICAFLFLFVNMPGGFTVQILLKLMMFILFIMVGDVFYHEYLVLIDRVNHNCLIWFMEIIKK